MKKKLHPFHASLTYTFTKAHLEVCANCGKAHAEHSEASCLFDSTVFRKQDLMRFFDHVMRHGGHIAIASGPFILKQAIKVQTVDTQAYRGQADIRTIGDAVLEENVNAAKRT